MIQTTDVYFGEKKQIRILIRSTCDESFVVSDATYTLQSGETVEESGICEVYQVSATEVMLKAMISPKKKCALYDLKYIYHIGQEKLIYICRVRTI